MPASFTTFAAPSFTLGTSNVTGTGDSVHAGATLLAFDATAATDNDYAQSGATGSAVVTSRRDHVHAMPPQPNLGSSMENFVESGLRCVYMLGAPKASAIVENDEVGFGSAWTFAYSGGTGTLVPSTVIRGGWALTCASSQSANLYVGDGVLSAADDWSVVYRVNRDDDDFSTTYFGLATDPTHFDASDNVIIFYWSRSAGEISTITDNGGTETRNTGVTSIANGVDVTFRIDITGNGGDVKFYVDDTLEATHTTNIPTSTALYIYVMQKAQGGAESTVNIGDIFAWRTS
jgi:hypothetical protein